MTFFDGATIQANQKAIDAEKGARGRERDLCEAFDQSRGSYDIKVCVIANRLEQPITFAQAPGQAHELSLVPSLLDSLPDVLGWITGDRSYASDTFRERV